MASDRYTFCRSLAREAGMMAHRAFGTSTTTLKGRHDVVTAMDGELERFIRAAIARQYPAEAIIGEEEGGAAGERLWLIDPIDGTANYARGIPHYCVSIGYLERGVPTVGVIHDPSHDWLYAAERGGGAWMNDARIHVSPRAALTDATVECGWSTRRPASDYVALIARVLGAGPVRWGSSTSRRAAARRTASCTSTPGTARPASCSCRRPVDSATISSPATASRPAIR